MAKTLSLGWYGKWGVTYRYGILKKSISSLKDRGFKIAIDDFGTGYSNFIALFEYNFDHIKIDGSLIKKYLQTRRWQRLSQI